MTSKMDRQLLLENHPKMNPTLLLLKITLWADGTNQPFTYDFYVVCRYWPLLYCIIRKISRKIQKNFKEFCIFFNLFYAFNFSNAVFIAKVVCLTVWMVWMYNTCWKVRKHRKTLDEEYESFVLPNLPNDKSFFKGGCDISVKSFRSIRSKQSRNTPYNQNTAKYKMDFLTSALSGVGISVVGLCLLRSWRARSWGAISRIPHLRDKSLNGKVCSLQLM